MSVTDKKPTAPIDFTSAVDGDIDRWVDAYRTIHPRRWEKLKQLVESGAEMLPTTENSREAAMAAAGDALLAIADLGAEHIFAKHPEAVVDIIGAATYPDGLGHHYPTLGKDTAAVHALSVVAQNLKTGLLPLFHDRMQLLDKEELLAKDFTHFVEQSLKIHVDSLAYMIKHADANSSAVLHFMKSLLKSNINNDAQNSLLTLIKPDRPQDLGAIKSHLQLIGEEYNFKNACDDEYDLRIANNNEHYGRLKVMEDLVMFLEIMRRNIPAHGDQEEYQKIRTDLIDMHARFAHRLDTYKLIDRFGHSNEVVRA